MPRDADLSPHLVTLQDVLGQMDRFGGAPAVLQMVEKNGEARTTFAELSMAAQTFAEHLREHPSTRRKVVGLLAPNSLAWIQAFWGIIGAGMAVMPIDWHASHDDIAYMMEIANCNVILTPGSRVERIQTIHKALKVIDLDAIASEIAQRQDQVHVLWTPHPPLSRPEDIAILAFTSGTTGLPKAVPLTHANLLSNVNTLSHEGFISENDRVLIPLPLHHIYPLTVGLLTVSSCGAGIVLPAGLSGPELVTALQRYRVTVLLGVPRLYTALVDGILRTAAARPPLTQSIFSALLSLSRLAQHRLGWPLGRWLLRSVHRQFGGHLRLMVCGGAALPTDIETGLTAFGWQVLTGYGLTETSPILTFSRIGHGRAGSAGQALPDVSLRIADADPTGVGEIEVHGSSVFSGYLHDDAATQAAFTPDGWFRTGDLGRLDRDSYLFVIARRTETIVLSNGKKIYPEIVEAAYSENPLIREIGLLGMREGLVALVVPNEEIARDAGAIRLEGLIRDALNKRARTLPPHLRLTGFSVTRSPLPRTQLGKLRRHLLPALYAVAHRPPARQEGTPMAPADKALLDDARSARLWRWLQSRFPDHSIDLETSPQLDLGIDSLGWIDLTLALQRECGISLTERQIARVVTLRDLLREAIQAPATSEIPPVIVESENRWLEDYGVGIHALRGVGEASVRVVMRSFFRLRVVGLESLPPRPFLLCPNHVSYLDPFALAAALSHQQLQDAYWAGWTGLLFNTPMRRLFSRAAQIVPIDPDRNVAQALALGASVLARQRTLIWFAEGGLSPDGALQTFLPGIGALWLEHPVAVVPVFISGTNVALPPGARFPRRTQITIRFGKPIDPARLASGPAGRAGQQHIANVIREAVGSLGSDPDER